MAGLQNHVGSIGLMEICRWSVPTVERECPEHDVLSGVRRRRHDEADVSSRMKRRHIPLATQKEKKLDVID